jgi:hypothetical protein
VVAVAGRCGKISRKGATTPGVVAERYVHRDDLPIVGNQE